MRAKTLLATVAFLVLVCCATVDVTKTAKRFYNPTNPNEVEILINPPEKSYVELGTVTVTGFAASETGKMHKAIRAKVAPLGANAVILTSEGIKPGILFSANHRWATGVAIRYNTGDEAD